MTNKKVIVDTFHADKPNSYMNKYYFRLINDKITSYRGKIINNQQNIKQFMLPYIP